MPRSSTLALANKRVSETTTIPAPTGGLNARDSLAMMQPDQAVQLINLFPRQYGCQVRRGWKQHVTGLGGPVETLMNYAAKDSTEKLFGVATGKFYDVTNPGPVGTALRTGYANSRWQHTMMANQFGNYISAVNGADAPQFYNGTVWADHTFTTHAGSPALTYSNLINVAHVHRRLWYVEKNTGNAWYLPTDQINGELTWFGVGETFPNGGFLVAIEGWSTDSGDGMNEWTVFVGSQGDVAVFEGFDPATSGSFNLKAVYKVGAPIGYRCVRKYGSDLLILSEDGVMPMSSVLGQSRVTLAQPLSDIIQQALSDDVTNFRPLFGWEMALFNRYQFLFVNVPISYTQKQYVMNSVTLAWCEFYGYEAHTWERLHEEPYFGADGFVGRAWYGTADDFSDTTQRGQSVPSQCLQAFHTFGSPGIQKHWTMCRPIFNAGAEPRCTVGMNTDYNLLDDSGAPPPQSKDLAPSLWNHAIWDEDKWSAGLRSFTRWFSVNDIGFAGAIYMKLASSNETNWVATHYVYETGGTL